MSKIEVDAITQQSGSTLTVGGGASKTVVADATTVTLGRCGGTVALASGASQTGFGRTGTVDWQTASIKTSTFTAANGEGYFANTSGGAFTMNLPAGSAGAIVSVSDYTRTFQTNNLTVSPNGSEKIGGVAATANLRIEGQAATFVYVDATEGWINIQETSNSVTGAGFICASVSGTGNTLATAPDCANTKIATFTGPGTFTVSQIASCAANNAVSHLIVAGGGGGASSHGAGGGGGGFREVKSPITPYTASPLDGYPTAPNRITVTAQAYPIVVGGGGAGGVDPSPNPVNLSGSQGGTSSFGGISSAGGGGGAVYSSNGLAGGSGGGGRASPGAGNTPPVTPPQGQNGGTGPGNGPNYAVGGGGGAGEVGGNACGNTCSGRGGAGVATHISASPLSYSGGGGSGTFNGGTAGAGSPCGTGGAAGTAGGNNPGAAGTINRGGGSGGRSYQSSPGAPGTAGGSGVVIIRYKFQ